MLRTALRCYSKSGGGGNYAKIINGEKGLPHCKSPSVKQCKMTVKGPKNVKESRIIYAGGERLCITKLL